PRLTRPADDACLFEMLSGLWKGVGHEILAQPEGLLFAQVNRTAADLASRRRSQDSPRSGKVVRAIPDFRGTIGPRAAVQPRILPEAPARLHEDAHRRKVRELLDCAGLARREGRTDVDEPQR